MTTGTIGNDNLSNDPNVFNETVDALDGDDVITIVTPNNLGIPGPTVTVNGGLGSDRLVVNTAGSFQAVTGTGTSGSLSVRFGPTQFYAVTWNAIERVELTGTLFGDGAFVTGDSIDVLRFTSSTARANIQTNGGADDIALTGTFIGVAISAGTGNDIVDLRGLTGVLETIGVQGGDGNDVLYASPLVDTLAGGNNNDALIFGSFLTAADGADGGAGTDTVVVQGNYPALVLGTGLVNNEVLLVASGSDTRFGDTAGNSYDYNITTVDANVAAGNVLSVSATLLEAGEDLVFNGAAETNGSFRIFTGAGNDTLTGGAAQDGFFFGADDNLTGADVVNGGGGTDSLALRGNYSGADAVVFQNSSFTNVEVVVLLSGLTNEFGGPIVPGGFDYYLTLADGNIAAGQRLDVIATNLAATESVTVNAAAETNGSVRILSGAGADNLIGSANADIIYGGLGADTINGGGNGDTYLYRAVAESTAVSRDTVTFTIGDRIDLSVIDANSGTGSNDAFSFIGAAAFSNTAGQLRAFQSAPNVWTVEGDVNGDGTADLVITVNSVNALVGADFIL
jgi:Ca2+-binding RTX toxin-like protein